MTRWWESRHFFAAAVLLSIVPLLWPSVPPLADLPGHIGRYRVMLGTDADLLSRWYSFHWQLQGNLGTDLLVQALAPLIGLEPTVRGVVISIAGLTATGLLWTSRETHGRVTPWALFALPLVYHYAFQYGFVNYCLAMALALNALALWLRLGRLARFRLRILLFVPISLIVWLAHVMGWGALGLMVFGVELARARDQRASWGRAIVTAGLNCLPLTLPAVLLLLWRSDAGAGTTNRFFVLNMKLAWLRMMLRDRWPVFDLGSVVLIVVVVYRSWREADTGAAPGLLYACLALAAAFLLLPFMLFDSAYTDMRLAPYATMLALVALRPGEGMPPPRLALIAFAGLAFLVARTAGTTVSFALYDRTWSRHLVALEHLPRGVRVVSMVGEPCVDAWMRPRIHHLPGMATARRAAFANNQWALGGNAMLETRGKGLGRFAGDPSQMVTAATCDPKFDLFPIARSLQELPRDRFDYLWLIDPPSHDPRLLRGLTPVWRSGTDVLYRIEHTRLSATRPTH